ncbi:PH domain-containing protein [Allokutzneria sp. A3M-2-11 16]|uniref:PH domain-containing protein n=1 Tax=Allokutzneria sp. A3M-2-11 16 TaxID=2962043 RepID=UPI0020B68604|nr:PH domain-containing protein [Allokutzneria sp. A3M-2-11 16]MCP3800806.1 PH domain-containing protein [Allokutzneria sp. A3M-2-11 16]
MNTAEPRLQLRLRPPANQVSRKAIGWWALQAVIEWAVLVGVLVAARLLFDWTGGWPTTLLVLVIVFAIAHSAVMPFWRYRVHRWETTEQAVYVQSGWFWLDARVAPVSRVQTVDMKRGPLQQWLGLATVVVTTASAAGPLEIAGLDHDVATRLVDELTVVAEAAQGDAT